MRVLQLGPYPPPHGGVQTNLVAIREQLISQGHECMALNLTSTQRPNEGGVYYPRSASEVMKLLWTLPYDIVHFHFGGMLSQRLLALTFVCTILPGRKSVMTFHSGGYPSSPEGRSASYWTLRGFVFRRLDAIIGVNAEIIAMFRKFGVPSGKLHQILPYVLKPAPDVAYREDVRRFFENHSPVLSTVGLLEPEYDLTLQIDVLEDIRQKHPRAGLIIAGSGSLHQMLEEHIRAKPFAEHVLLAGDVPHEITLKTIQASAALLRTTLYDGDSVAVRESLHFGTPVIATDNGMRPAGVHLVPAQNRAALRDAILDELQRDDGERGGKTAKTGNIQQVIEVYDSLLVLSK